MNFECLDSSGVSQWVVQTVSGGSSILCPTPYTVTISQAFNPASLDAASLAGAFTAGASVLFVPLALVWACVVVIRLLR